MYSIPLPIIHNNTYSILHNEQRNRHLAPIGIFDSGVGGLSVAIEIAQYLPNERILYFADTANVPYGAKSDQEIRNLTAKAVDWLFKQGCKIVVVACNSASAFSLDYLREYYGDTLPIIGLVPALKPAILHSKNKVVAVLATPATFRGKLIQDVVKDFAEPSGTKVIPITCLDLVPFVEKGEQMSEKCLTTLKNILLPAISQGADTLVLGCTHYPFLKPAIEQIFANQLMLIDSGVAVARQTSRVLLQKQLNNLEAIDDQCRLDCYASGGNSEYLQDILQRLIPTHFSWQIKDVFL